MIFTSLFCLAHVVRHVVGRRHQIHPVTLESAVDDELLVVEDAAGETVETASSTAHKGANEPSPKICKKETSVDEEDRLPSSHGQCDASKKGTLVDTSCVEGKDTRDLFWSNKSLIERQFCACEFAPKETGSNEDNWKVLYRQLENSMVFTDDMALHFDPQCKDRNRYRNILPYDNMSRVQLREGDNDYINASYVAFEETNTTYILTQGPMKNTASHFWQMVWEQGSVGIVMLCRCVETGREKCSQYWPTQRGRQMICGGYAIENLECTRSASHSLSYLLLRNLDTNNSRRILHYSYTSWPDFGVPQSVVVFLEFLMEVRDSGVMECDVGPVVVHCSAGVGRSGVFAATDVALSWLERGKSFEELDIRALLLLMRRQRLGLVQSPEQLRFVYAVVLTAAHDLLGHGQSIRDLKMAVKSYGAEMERSRDLCSNSSLPSPRPLPHAIPPTQISPSPITSLSSIPSYSGSSSCTSSLSSFTLPHSVSSLYHMTASPLPSLPQTHTSPLPQTHTSPLPQTHTSPLPQTHMSPFPQSTPTSSVSPGAVVSDSESDKMKTKNKSWFKGLKKLFRRKKKKK